MPLAVVLAGMEYRGVRVDTAKLAACSESPIDGTDGGTIDNGSGGEVASPGGCNCGSLDGTALLALAGLVARGMRRRSRE